MRISDWSSDVCSSDLRLDVGVSEPGLRRMRDRQPDPAPVARHEPLVEPREPQHLRQRVLAGAAEQSLVEASGGVEIGSESCWVRVCLYGWISVVASSLKKKPTTQYHNHIPDHV